MIARLSALLVVALLAACSSAPVDRDAARVAAPATPMSPLPLPTVPPPAAALALPAEPAPPTIGAPLALAPLNAEPILARATPVAPPEPAAPVAAYPAVPPATEVEIRLVQETLADQHLYRGPLDGQFTTELRDAVLQYQRRKGLPQTAMLDPETLRRIDADASGDAAYGAGEAGATSAGTGR